MFRVEKLFVFSLFFNLLFANTDKKSKYYPHEMQNYPCHLDHPHPQDDDIPIFRDDEPTKFPKNFYNYYRPRNFRRYRRYFPYDCHYPLYCNQRKFPQPDSIPDDREVTTVDNLEKTPNNCTPKNVLIDYATKIQEVKPNENKQIVNVNSDENNIVPVIKPAGADIMNIFLCDSFNRNKCDEKCKSLHFGYCDCFENGKAVIIRCGCKYENKVCSTPQFI